MDPYCEGEKVYLRPVHMADVSLIVEWKRNPVVQRMALYPGVQVSVENQERDIHRAIKSGNELYLIVVIKETDQPIGYVRCNLWEGQPGSGWLRFALGKERGKGYGKDAIKCFVKKFLEKGHRIDAEVYEYNEVCLGLLNSLGFVREGVKRKAFFEGQKYVDLIVFGLLKSDLE